MYRQRNIQTTRSETKGQDPLKMSLFGVSCLDIHEWNSEMRNLEISMEEMKIENMRNKFKIEEKIIGGKKAMERIEFLEREERVRKKEEKILTEELNLEKKLCLLKAAFNTDV